MGIRNNIAEAMETTTREKTIQATNLDISKNIAARNKGMDKQIS